LLQRITITSIIAISGLVSWHQLPSTAVRASCLPGPGVESSKDPPSMPSSESRAGDESDPPPTGLAAIDLFDSAILRIVAGAEPGLLLDGRLCEPGDLAAAIAGRPVIMGPDPETELVHVLTALDLLRTADPPVPVVGVVLIRLVNGCITPASEARKRRREAGWLAQPIPIPRDSLGDEAVRIIVGTKNMRASAGIGQPFIELPEVSHLAQFLRQVMGNHPGRPIIITGNPETPFVRVDIVLDVLLGVDSHPILLATTPDHGLLLETRFQGPDHDPEARIRQLATPYIRQPMPVRARPTPTPLPVGEPIRYVPGGPLTRPVRIAGADPAHPENVSATITGSVILEVVINRDGTLGEIKVLRGLPLGYTKIAVEAVRSWRFQPATYEGQPVDAIYVLSVHFTH
jgi:protein TonB